MKAGDLRPGMEVAVGGAKYGRRFAIVVQVGRWTRQRASWQQSDYAPLCVLVAEASRSRSADEVRQWWQTTGRHLTEFRTDVQLTTVELINVRATWTDHLVTMEGQQALQQERRLQRQQTEQEMRARADALTAKLGVAVEWGGGQFFTLGIRAAQVLLGEDDV